jgi:hypothetical protein
MLNTDHVREQAAREFDSQPALAMEFSSKEAYVCYRAAMARGAAKIFRKTAASASRVSQPALAAEFSSPEAEAAYKAAEARGAARIFGKPAGPAPRVEPGCGAESGVRSGGGAGGFVYSGEFASKLGQAKWACPVSDATLKVALGLMQSGETRHMSRNAVAQLIAKRAGVGLDVADVARAMAIRIKGQP